MPKRSSKLNKRDIDKLFYQLCVAISGMKTAQEAAEFLRDLISYQEAEMIAKRLKIADLLLNGHKYEDIKEDLGVGAGTIARVQEWLVVSGEGYRKAVLRTKKITKEKDQAGNNGGESLSQIKRRYPLYAWPEIVLENVMKSMTKREKDKLRAVVGEMDKMKEKTLLYRQLKKMGF